MYNCTDGLKSVNEEYYCCSNASCETRGDIHKCYRGSGFQGNGETCTHMTNCQDYFKLGFNISGIYTIKPTVGNGSSFAVFCNMADGGGWTVFQRRVNGSVVFNRNWTSYKEGFGELTHEFWLGNEKLYYLTNQSQYQLRVDLVNEDGEHYYALYKGFQINDESDHYRLSVGSYRGTVGHAGLRRHSNYKFSTFDMDNDASNELQAVTHHGAWWYGDSFLSNLNGPYYPPENSRKKKDRIYWKGVPGYINYTEMKIKPSL